MTKSLLMFSPATDVEVTTERQKEVVDNFYRAFLDVLSEFHGIRAGFHPDNQFQSYVDGNNVACFAEDVANGFNTIVDELFEAYSRLGTPDAIYTVAMNHFDFVNPGSRAVSVFPEWTPGFEIPQSWEDTSYKNDVCPSFCDPNGYRMKLFVDYLNPERRDFPEGKRFVMYASEEAIIEDCAPLLETDDVEEVITLWKSRCVNPE